MNEPGATPTIPSSATGGRGWFVTRWTRLALAVTFLTRLPLPVRGEVTSADLRASLAWYPLIGLGLGAAGWGGYTALSHICPPLLAAALVILLLEASTGALHLDGVMDTCDGIGSGAPRARALEIMKDSRVGAMGVFGAVAILLLKVAALSALSPTTGMLPLLVGWSAARMLPAVNVACYPYARPSGTGALFAGAGHAPAVVSVIIALSLATVVGGVRGAALAVVVALVVLLAQAGISRRLGGLTGDVYGLGIELAETLALIGGCVLTRG